MTMFKFPGREDETVFEDLPESSRQGLLSRAIARFTNEKSSALLAYGKAQLAKNAGNGATAGSFTNQQAAEYRDSHVDEMAAYATKWFADKYIQMVEGKLGTVSTSGAVIDPLEKEMLRIASEEIRTVFKNRDWKFPRGEDTFTAGKITLDRDGWIDRWLKHSDDRLINPQKGRTPEPNEPRIRKMAERNLASKAALAKRVASVEVEGDELGL